MYLNLLLLVAVDMFDSICRFFYAFLYWLSQKSLKQGDNLSPELFASQDLLLCLGLLTFYFAISMLCKNINVN